jgi:iron complex transport system ATP-binding protein
MVSILETMGLSFSYEERPVFENIDFSLEKGELLVLLGPNGAGKSTLFRCILGLESRYTGRVLINGEDIRGKKPIQMARLMAYVPQKIHPVFNYSVMEMVLMGTTAGGRERGSNEKKLEEKANLALETAGIGGLAGRDFLELSGGEQQLVLIARALVQDVQILVIWITETSCELCRKSKTCAKSHSVFFFRAITPTTLLYLPIASLLFTTGKSRLLENRQMFLTGI